MLAKLEKKITEFKKKQDPRFVGVFMFAVFGLVTLIAMNFANVYGREKQSTTDAYNRAMYEVITSVNNADILVAKVRITMSKEYNIVTLSEITTEATTAKENLGQLPVNQGSMGNVSKFFSQVIGFSQALTKKLANGNELTDEDHKNLKKINEVSNNLNSTLQKIYLDLTKGSLKWDDVEKVATDKLSEDKNKLELNGLEKIKDNLEDYEGLIYDGAYSSHIESAKPKALTGKVVSVAEASKKVIECVKSATDREIEEVIYNGESKGRLELYNFEVKLKDTEYSIAVDITKQDGMLALLMSDRPVAEKKLEIETAKEIGDKYLQSLGLKNFEPTYYQTTQNMATINYAAVQAGVLLYPDLIKVKIAMDTGEVCSVECTGYIFNHNQRNNLVPTITEEQAKANLSKDMKLEKSRLAIIPTNSNNEVLTYEFKGTIEDKEFLIYINAKTGKEENILLLLNTPGRNAYHIEKLNKKLTKARTYRGVSSLFF